MNPLVVVIGGVVLIGGGYLAYKFVQASSPVNQITALAGSAVGTVEDILNKDPISVTSVAGDVKKGASSVVHTAEGAVSTIEGWL